MGLTATTVVPARLAERVHEIGTEQAFSFTALIAQVENGGEPIIRCNLGQPDFPLPAHIAEAVIEALRNGRTTYCDPQGLIHLRVAIAESLGTKHGLEIHPDQVVVFPGGRAPIGLAQHIYIEPGDEVVYPTPCYPLFESFIRYVGGVPVPMPLSEEHGFTVRPEDLEPLLSEKTRLIYLNFPSNPTGGVASRDELMALAKVILDKAPPDARVYSDESYEAIVFDGLEHISIASLPNMAERTIIASGVSKTYSWTGGRVGWGVYPTIEEAMVHRNFNINYFASIPPYNQVGARVALQSPESPPVIRKMVAAFQRRRDRVLDGLNAIPGIECSTPKGAFYAFPNVSGVIEKLGADRLFDGLPEGVKERSSPSTLLQLFLLYRYRVATMDRRSFGVRGSEGQHFLRLSIANSEKDLVEAVGRLAEASEDVKGFEAYVRSGVRLAL